MIVTFEAVAEDFYRPDFTHEVAKIDLPPRSKMAGAKNYLTESKIHKSKR